MNTEDIIALLEIAEGATPEFQSLIYRSVAVWLRMRLDDLSAVEEA